LGVKKGLQKKRGATRPGKSRKSRERGYSAQKGEKERRKAWADI